MSWADHLRKHITEREEERMHLRCKRLEVAADPTFTDTERKKALTDISKDEKRLDSLIQSLIDAQAEND